VQHKEAANQKSSLTILVYHRLPHKNTSKQDNNKSKIKAKILKS
jgi:hypothetical protein